MHLKPHSLVLLLACLQPPLLAQEAAEFDPVEASVADVSVLSTSLRVEQLGLDPGTGFKQVYRVPGASDTYFRANGGLFAVFDQSVYLSWNGLSFPEVPPSTTFYIGAPAFLRSQDEVTASGPSVDGSRRFQPGPSPHRHGMVSSTDSLQEEPMDVALPRFITDHDYRSRRLNEIRRLRSEASSPPALD